jgi:hypothetical protein
MNDTGMSAISGDYHLADGAFFVAKFGTSCDIRL